MRLAKRWHPGSHPVQHVRLALVAAVQHRATPAQPAVRPPTRPPQEK